MHELKPWEAELLEWTMEARSSDTLDHLRESVQFLSAWASDIPLEYPEIANIVNHLAALETLIADLTSSAVDWLEDDDEAE